MKKYFLSLLLLSSTLIAERPCWELSAEWLYFQIGIDAQPFVSDNADLVTSQSEAGRTYYNLPRWHSGFRLEGTYYFPNNVSALRVRGTLFPEFVNETSVTGIFTTTFGSFPAIATTASTQDTIHFAYLEVLYDHLLIESGPISFAFQGGALFMRLKARSISSSYFLPDFDIMDQDITRKGIGPEIGADISTRINSSFSAKMRVAGALVVTDYLSHWVERQDTATFFANDDARWKILPFFNARLGLSYMRPYACFCLNLEAGYEVLTCINAIGQYLDFDVREFYCDFNGHGPYVQASVAF